MLSPSRDKNGKIRTVAGRGGDTPAYYVSPDLSCEMGGGWRKSGFKMINGMENTNIYTKCIRILLYSIFNVRTK